jgi:hypothetical protein
MKAILYIFFLFGMAIGGWLSKAHAAQTAGYSIESKSINYQQGDSTRTEGMLVLPQVLNMEKVRQKVVIAHASECISLSGSYDFEIFVDKEGNYVSHKPSIMDKQVNMAKLLSELTFEPASLNGRIVSTWIVITFDFGPDKEK